MPVSNRLLTEVTTSRLSEKMSTDVVSSHECLRRKVRRAQNSASDEEG